jgi:hypothetical protein
VADSLGFVLRLEQGRGALGLARAWPTPFGRVDDLVLELPDVRYPFDLSEGVGRFRDQRTRLRSLRLTLASEDLRRLLDRPGLAAVGLRLLGVEVAGAGARAAFRVALEARIAGAAVPVTTRGSLAAAPDGQLRVELDVPRVFGELPLAAPLLVSGWWSALGAGWATQPPALLRQRGLLACEVAARELALFALLPAHGWRLPERAAVTLAEVTVGTGGLVLGFERQDHEGEAGRDGAGVGGDMGVGRHGDQGIAGLLVDGDGALAAGSLRAAEEWYRQAVDLAPDDRRAADRLLALLAIAPAAERAYEREMEAQRARSPEAVFPLLARASLSARRGRVDEAVATYERVAALCLAAGEPVDAASAHVAAAQLWSRDGRSDAAGRSLERAAACWPHGAGPSTADSIRSRLLQGRGSAGGEGDPGVNTPAVDGPTSTPGVGN